MSKKKRGDRRVVDDAKKSSVGRIECHPVSFSPLWWWYRGAKSEPLATYQPTDVNRRSKGILEVGFELFFPRILRWKNNLFKYFQKKEQNSCHRSGVLTPFPSTLSSFEGGIHYIRVLLYMTSQMTQWIPALDLFWSILLLSLHPPKRGVWMYRFHYSNNVSKTTANHHHYYYFLKYNAASSSSSSANR